MQEDTEDCVAKFTSLVRIGPGEWLSFQLLTSKLFWSWAIAFEYTSKFSLVKDCQVDVSPVTILGHDGTLTQLT